MKRALRFVLLFIIGSSTFFCHGQSTNVSITVVSPPGQNWLNGTISYKFKPTPNFPGNSQWQGADLPSNYLVVTTLALNGSGGATFTLPSNTAITPAGSMWTITVCPNATVQCVTTDLAVSGASQDISSPINANLNDISVQGLNVPLAYNDSEIKTTVRTGAVYINTTRNVPEWYNGTAWQDFGGGGGALPQGAGTNQFANAGATAFVSGGVLDTDVFTDASGTQTAQCTTGFPNFPCSLYTPPTSSNTEMGRSLPADGANISNYWEDYRYNSKGLYSNSPIPQANGSTKYPLIGPSQTGTTSIVGFPRAFPANYGYAEGSAQNGQINVTDCTVGYSNGPANRDISPDLFTPLPGYSDVAAWAGCAGQVYIFNKSEAGIAQSQTFFTNCNGGGDCQGQAWFTEYAGGCMSDSDECGHLWGSIHGSTPGNTLGVVDTIEDPGTSTGLMRFHANMSVEPGMQGQLRYVIGDSVMTLNADRIGPSSGNTPPTVTFNDGTFTPSSARGIISGTQCNVATQLDGVEIGNNNGTPGCEVTVDTSFGAGHFVGLNTTSSPDPMCSAYHTGGLYNLGSLAVSATTISGGKQTIQMSLRRSLPIGSVVYQGGIPGCGYALDWTGDRSQARNYHQNFVDGTVLPSIGVTDTHTVLVPTYFASGINYAFTLYPSSHAGTREIATGTTGEKPLAITANLTRTGGNLVTGVIQPSNLPFGMWLGQVFVTVSGCPQTDFNGVKASPPTNQFKMPGPTNNTFTYVDAGSNGTCTGAKLVPQGTVVEFRHAAEILNVSNQVADGTVSGDQSVDGTLWTTLAPGLATVGNNVTIPPNYAAASDIINLNNQAAQPMLQSIPFTVIVSGNSGQSGFNAGGSSGIGITNIQHPEDMAGTGGNVPPIEAIHIFGPFPFRGLIDSDFAPSPFGGFVINIGPAYGFYYPKSDVNSSFRTYPVMCLSGDDQQPCTNYMLHEIDTNTISFGFNHAQRDQIQFNDHLSQFLIPTGFNALEIETNLGGVFGGNFVPTAALTQCTTLEPNGFAAGPDPCYRTATTSLGSGTPTVGSPFTTRSIYMMIGNDVDGKFASGEYVVPFNASPVTSSFPTTLTCLDLPAGATATFYLVQPGISFLPIPGPGCTAPTDTVVDNGIYGAAIGPDPWIAGKILYSGGFAGNEFGLVTSDVFGATGASNRITARIMQASPGVFRLDGAAQGDGQGSLDVLNLNVSGTCTGCGGGGGGIANIIITLPTSSIGANACTSPSTATMTGLVTTSSLSSAFATNPNAVTGWGTAGGLVFTSWPTANTLNWSVCNQTASPITPGAMNLNIGAR